MASYSIRVVLHGATAAQYERLHQEMARLGCQRYIIGDDGIRYDLPDGNYQLYSQASATAVRDAVGATADTIRPQASVLVVEAVRQLWRLRPVPAQS